MITKRKLFCVTFFLLGVACLLISGLFTPEKGTAITKGEAIFGGGFMAFMFCAFVVKVRSVEKVDVLGWIKKIYISCRDRYIAARRIRRHARPFIQRRRMPRRRITH